MNSIKINYNTPMIGKVLEEVDGDGFLIKFEVPGLIDEGEAVPLHTMQQPQPGDEISVWGGDGILNSLFVYSLNQYEPDIIYKAWDNYIQNYKGGMQVVSKDGDTLMEAGNCAMVRGKAGAGMDGDGGPIDIHNSKKKLEDLFVSIFKILSGTASMYTAAGSPVLLVNPSEVNNLAQGIQQLFGTVDVTIQEHGGGGGSGSGASSPGTAQQAVDLATIKDIVKDISTQLKSGVVSPMGPCSCPGAAAVDVKIGLLK